MFQIYLTIIRSKLLYFIMLNFKFELNDVFGKVLNFSKLLNLSDRKYKHC